MFSLLSASQSFSPLVYSPVLWLDAFNPSGNSNAVLPADGSSVATWVDKSASGINATQATGANQPVFSYTGLNSRPAMTFNGSSQYFLNGTGNLITGQAMTIFFVAAATNIVGTARPTFYSTRRNADAGAWQFEAGSTTAANSLKIATPNNVLARTAANTVTTNPSIFVYRRTAGKTNSMYINNISKTLTLATNIDFVTNSSTKLIGQGNGLAAIHYMTGSIGEIIMINENLNNQHVTIINGYLGRKWGISV
jgi:hypothetical protein